jgi:ribokinase
MLDMISIGDATLDVFLQLNEQDADVKCTVKEQECVICFNYADKIPVESVIKIPAAGNGSNAAVGAARLGLKSAIFSIVGDDSVGREIVATWKKEKVSTRHVTLDKKRGTNYSTVLNYRGERTILVFHEKRSYRFPKDLPAAKWVYYTSLGKGSEVMHKSLLAYLKRTGAKLCFQPGTHQLKLGAAAIQPLIAASEVTVVNKEEAERLVGETINDMRELLTRLHRLGCRTAVITDGLNGSFAHDGQRFLKIGIFDTPVLERTGCGDAFTTALVAALNQDLDLSDAMRWGTGNSASVIGAIGPQAGLLTAAQMKRMLARFKSVPVENL